MNKTQQIGRIMPASGPVQIDPTHMNRRSAAAASPHRESKMDEAKLRQAVCDAGHQLWLRRMICGDGGFVSAELNRRRFITTPMGRRRADLKPNQLLCVDLGGIDMLSADPNLPEQAWRPHRLAYQGAAYLETAGNGSGRQIHATALATPPNVMALHSLAANADRLPILHLEDLTVVDPDDEKALQRGILAGPIMLLRGLGVLVSDRSVDDCLNHLESLEHHAAIELATSGWRDS